MYIYDLPYIERKKLCEVLDQRNVYEELGVVHMGFEALTVKVATIISQL